MKKYLSPIRRRLRLRHALQGGAWGVMAALAAGAVVIALSFFIPLAQRNTLLGCCLLFAPAGALTGLMWPVPLMTAARAADEAGLRERAQTALALADRQDAMAALQRRDAQRALGELNVRRALPLRLPRAPLIAAGACLAAGAALLLLPNPQTEVLRQWRQFQQRMEQPAALLEQTAESLEAEQPEAQSVQELRRLLGDLARQLRETNDAREALTALSQGQRQLERLLSDNRRNASEALGQAGLEAIAQALGREAGQAETEQSLAEALAEALDQLGGAEAADRLQAAADQAGNTAAGEALQAAAEALSQGDAGQAASALSQLSASGASAAQAEAALQGAKAMTGAQGQGEGRGEGMSGAGQGRKPVQQPGGGAGQGSTNEDQSGQGGSQSGGISAQTGSRYKVEEYESIYDPTRLGDGGVASQSTGQVDENGQISELTLGPGLGDAAGSVPYGQVVGEYQSAAVQQALQADLPEYARQWVADHFSALTE